MCKIRPLLILILPKLLTMNTETAKNKSPLGKIILKAGLIAGTLDICAAFIYSYIKRGTPPQNVLQYIAKVVFGKDRFTEAWILNLTGLLIHYCIAFSWTILFFIFYPRMKWMQKNFLITGIVYGLFVWTMMTTIILPLWNGKAFVFNPESSTINAAILVLAIGMPLSVIARKNL